MEKFSLNRIFHPTDFSSASYTAFAHALRLAVEARVQLTILHTEGESLTDENQQSGHLTGFPHVRRTLERWGFLPAQSAEADFRELGVSVKKVLDTKDDTVQSVLTYLNRHSHDLIVLATHQRAGWDRWLHKATAEPLVRRAGEMTLFIPAGVDGFVSSLNGAVTLQNILVPVDRTPNPQMAVEAVAALADAIGYRSANFTLLHVGDKADFPRLRLPERIKWHWRANTRQGDVVTEILQAAHDCSADLIAMTTQGHHGFLDALRGSTTERVVRVATCPVLAVPATES